MIIRLIGAACIIFASTLLGSYWSRLDDYRKADLQELKKALSLLKTEIIYAITPLPEALEHIGNRLETFKLLFLEISKEFKNRNGESAYVIWERTIVKLKGTHLNREDKEILINFGKALGYLDKEMQTKNIELTIEYLEEHIGKLAESQSKNRKLYQSLGILGGLLLTIILL